MISKESAAQLAALCLATGFVLGIFFMSFFSIEHASAAKSACYEYDKTTGKFQKTTLKETK